MSLYEKMYLVPHPPQPVKKVLVNQPKPIKKWKQI